MQFLTNLRLILTVARRELTSILRGKAERLLFIWISLFFMPLITLGIMAVFLVMRTTDIIHPMRVSVAQDQANNPQMVSLMHNLAAFPEIVVEVEKNPEGALADGKTDAVLRRRSAEKYDVVSRDYGVEKRVSRAIEAARMRAIVGLLNKAEFVGAYPYYFSQVTVEQYKIEGDYMRQTVIALYAMAFVYAVLWLIPAIDVVRFDFLQNNIYANLCLPVPMNIVTGGKLLSGIVVTLIPTVLSSLAFVFSILLALVVSIDYYSGGAVFFLSPAYPLLPNVPIPYLEICLLPILVLTAVAFMHAWLMMIVVFFQGQRIALLLSTSSLLLLAQGVMVFGALSPPDQVWLDCVPWFGLGAVVHQMSSNQFNAWGLVCALVSTLALTAVMVRLAGKFYRLEAWTSWFKSNRPVKVEVTSAAD